MVVFFEQKEEKFIKRPIKELLWKFDGKVVLVKGKEQIKSLLMSGFKQLTKKEKERFKEGSYNPVYDLRNKKVKVFSLEDFFSGNKKDITYFNLLEI